LTKLYNNELPSVKAADLVNFVVFVVLCTRTNSSYRTVQLLSTGKCRRRIC